ncbi:MAG: 4Fe-4S cluster-binding domain-containing protein [Methanobrevibacter sp.]|nr:4Fe-4S cluster-binding domain-containing protein [Methanobrevibacter sp.]
MFQYTDTSIQEIPGKISLILYTGGCNLTCPWCFNKDIRYHKPLSWKQMKEAIDEYRDFVDGVVFSGGEPLLNRYLIKTIKYAKSNGLKVKINTNGLVSSDIQDNWYVGFIDYLNVSLKGTFTEYNAIMNNKPFCSLCLCADILEYSFVYSPVLWPPAKLSEFHNFLKNQLSDSWYSLFNYDHWTRPDILTVSQLQSGFCWDEQLNNIPSPTEQECIDVACIFRDIPKKKLMVETKEYGRKIIEKKHNNKKKGCYYPK